MKTFFPVNAIFCNLCLVVASKLEKSQMRLDYSLLAIYWFIYIKRWILSTAVIIVNYSLLQKLTYWLAIITVDLCSRSPVRERSTAIALQCRLT